MLRRILRTHSLPLEDKEGVFPIIRQYIIILIDYHSIIIIMRLFLIAIDPENPIFFPDAALDSSWLRGA